MKPGKYLSKEVWEERTIKRCEEIRTKHLMKRTDAELKTKSILDDMGIVYEEEYPIYSRSGFILVDFYIPSKKIAIEIDGSSHDGRLKSWQSYNKWREKLIYKFGATLLRFNNDEILNISDNFREIVLKKVNSL